jgi:hypothetical protein
MASSAARAGGSNKSPRPAYEKHILFLLQPSHRIKYAFDIIVFAGYRYHSDELIVAHDNRVRRNAAAVIEIKSIRISGLLRFRAFQFL